MIVMLLLDEQFFVEVVIDAGNETSESGSSYINRQVVCHHAVRVHGKVPCLEERGSDCESWIETRTCEFIDIAKGPEYDTDCRDAPNPHIWSNCVLACRVKDKEHKDESANNLHVECAVAFLENHLIIFDIICRDCLGQKEGDLTVWHFIFTILWQA